jgi:uroporphyrinogen-III synthase
MKKDYDEKTLLNNLQKTKIVSIGPFTSEELNKLDLQNTVADVHTVPGAFETLKNIFSLA